MSDRMAWIFTTIMFVIISALFFNMAHFLYTQGFPGAAIVPAAISGFSAFWVVLAVAFIIRPDAAKRQAK